MSAGSAWQLRGTLLAPDLNQNYNRCAYPRALLGALTKLKGCSFSDPGLRPASPRYSVRYLDTSVPCSYCSSRRKELGISRKPI